MMKEMDPAKFRSVVDTACSFVRLERKKLEPGKKARIKRRIRDALYRRGVFASRNNISAIREELRKREVRLRKIRGVSQKNRQTLASMIVQSRLSVVNTHREAKKRLRVVRRKKKKEVKSARGTG